MLRYRPRVGWLFSGENVPSGAARFFRAPAMAFGIAFLAFWIGLSGSLFTTEIRGSTSRFLQAEGGQPDRLVIVFWVFALVWALLFYVRLIAEADEKNDLVRAIQRCPNPRVLHSHLTFCFRVEEALRGWERANDEADGLDALQQRLVAALRIILEFAREFSDPVPGALRGCNVMLIASPDELPAAVALRFYPSHFDSKSLRAVLYMDPQLVVSSGELGHVAPIALPVPTKPVSDRGTRRCLPGAPFALITGKMSVHTDTRNLAGECGDFDADVRDELAEYFSESGEGCNVRSFASVRVGDEIRPVAVLNLDYSHPGILGPAEYCGTFLALLTPFLFLLREPLDLYGRLSKSSARAA